MDRIIEKSFVTIDGADYVIVLRDDFDRLSDPARAADLPPLPKPSRSGHVPAVEYARASQARKIIRGRVEAGLTQRELAKRAGMSFEHLCRIESGLHTPSVPTIEKIDRVLSMYRTDDRNESGAMSRKTARGKAARKKSSTRKGVKGT